MLRNVKQMEGRALRARDGVIGEVKDFYFDDHHWHVRYLVIETGAWLNKRKVLISPDAIGPMDWGLQVFPVNLTMEQVRNSPSIDTDKPVSRQHEESLRKYYGWPPYWGGVFGEGGIAGPITTPELAGASGGLTDGNAPLRRRGNPNLRSVKDTRRYHIVASDGAIGHVDDFLIDEESWRVRYLIIDTRNWIPGRKVVVAPGWIHEVRWETRTVHVDLTRDAIKASPHYDPAEPWTRNYAAELHDHYNRPRYSDWDKDITAGAPKLEKSSEKTGAKPPMNLKAFLDSRDVRYETLRHEPAYTAPETAASVHVPGRDFAKTVIVETKGESAMIVVPANRKIVLSDLRDMLADPELRLAPEDHFIERFPDCELGAMPPFGNLYGLRVYVAKCLADEPEIAFNAGTHREAIKMSFHDFAALVQPIILDFATV